MEIQEFEEMPEELFRRLMGIRKRTFVEMASVLQTAEAQRKARGGKPNHLTVATRLVMTLEYWREYRTYLHIGHSYGVSERRPIAIFAGAKTCSSGAERSHFRARKPFSPATESMRSSSSTRRKRPWSAPKKAAPPLFGQEKSPHAEDAARRGQGHRHDYLRRPCGRPPT